MQGAKGSRPPEHGDPEADFTQPAETGNQLESGHPRQTPASRLEGGLPPQSPTRLRRDCPVRPYDQVAILWRITYCCNLRSDPKACVNTVSVSEWKR